VNESCNVKETRRETVRARKRASERERETERKREREHSGGNVAQLIKIQLSVAI